MEINKFPKREINKFPKRGIIGNIFEDRIKGKILRIMRTRLLNRS